jgi:phosphohistidine phosphatase SixA
MRLHLPTGLLAAVVCAAVLVTAPVLAQRDTPHRRHHAHWHSKPGAVTALRLLREGGNVLVVRHAKTDMLAKDARGGDFADCGWQRNLSPMGREASREMGEAVRLLTIPVGDIWSSPYCRCMDTARLAFGRADAVAALAPASAPGQGMREAGAALSAILAKGAPNGTNVVVVAHIFNAQGALGEIPEEGETFVVRADATGVPRIAARLTMTQWGDLVRDLLVFGLDPADDHRASSHDGGPAGHGAHGR